MLLLRKLDDWCIRAAAFAAALLYANSAWAIDARTIENLTKKGLGLAIWIAIGVFGVIGIIVFGSGVTKMWDTDDPRQKKSGYARMGWGAFLLIAVLVAVALKMYFTEGANPTATDLNPYSGGLNSPSTMFQ